ncbi:MAG: hypothetical protein R2748_12685 [Bryobacterales bacterium]
MRLIVTSRERVGQFRLDRSLACLNAPADVAVGIPAKLFGGGHLSRPVMMQRDREMCRNQKEMANVEQILDEQTGRMLRLRWLARNAADWAFRHHRPIARRRGPAASL